MISWLPYPWQQRTARAVKVQDYEVMVHKGFGSDKVVCGSERVVTLGQQKPGFLTDNEVDSATNLLTAKTPEYVVTFCWFKNHVVQFFYWQTSVYVFLQTRS